MTKQNSSPKITASKVTMPSGGGALRGISEPFKAQSFTGSGGFSVPLPLPDARGFSPSVSLAYNSGSGNGIFGLGFSVSTDSIVRKTSNGIPRYDNTDTFILGSAGELLPKYNETLQGWEKSEYSYTQHDVTWHIEAYRPRTEGGFALIELWTDEATLLSRWKVVTAENITHWYGLDESTRIYNPENQQQIFEWLLEASYDAHGNKIVYNYKAGDTVNIPQTIYNSARDFTSQRYIDTIKYGNYYITEQDNETEYFAFEIVFDYGQLDKDNPDAPATEWVARPDAFSSYKSGFEIRTARLCNGVYLKHFFNGKNNNQAFTTAALLVQYATTSFSGISIITQIVNRGYRTSDAATLLMADTPAVQLSYQEFNPQSAAWQLLQADAPSYFNSSGFMPVDLDGLGIDGLLYSTDTFTGYLAPLGNGKYSPMRVLDNFPVFSNLQSEQINLTSLEGNSVLDLVVNDGVSNGFFEHSGSEDWKQFQPFANFPEEYLSPQKDLVDISGTGRSDLLFFDNNQLKFYPSEGKTGFSAANYTYKPAYFPATAQQGEEELLGFGDFLGDGLSHRYCLRNGSLTVWPCLGHGNYGEAINFANAPQIEGLFDASRVFLIDADGNGATDIVYCYAGYARIWFNQNGNTFSNPIDIAFPQTYSSITAITAGDVSGYGTTSLIFTVADTKVKHLYYDFSNKLKPYLLQTVDNGIGELSALTYSTSVLEQLRDKQEGRIWPTRLPIAVSVVSESTVTDQITGAVYTQRFRYHDGYFDSVEREFRGFGFVETWDCENYEQYTALAQTDAKAATLLEKDLWMPPIYTRAWFITGAYQQTPAICAQYETQFYKGDEQQWSIPTFELDAAWNNQDAEAVRQAYAALAGQPIRTETYADDNSPIAQNPYTVSMSTVQVRLVQPRINGRYCSVMPVPVNSLDYTYDRNPHDPRISQNLVLSMDEYGHPLLSASISFPRRDVEGVIIYPEQQQLRVVVNEATYINTINTPQNPDTFWQYLGVSWQGRSYEVGNLTQPTNAPFTQSNLLQQVQVALQHLVPPIDSLPAQEWSRLLGWNRTVYWNNDGTGILPYGQINALALLHHAETAELSPDEITHAFGDKITDDLLTNRCGYVQSDGYWWNYGQMQWYNWDSKQFYLPTETNATISQLLPTSILDDSGLNGASAVQYDTYKLAITQTTATLTNDISISQTYQYDYYTMQPVRSTDANNNITEVVFDALGQVIATTVYGTIGNPPIATGDMPISQYTVRENTTFDAVLANPAYYLQGATTFFYYDIFAWKNNAQPLNTITVTRTLHANELLQAGVGLDETQIPISISYSNGLGEALQSKVKTIPNPAQTPANIQWVVSGYTIYNNKNLPVEQYQPYYSTTPYFENQYENIEQQPPPTVIHYDAVGRVIRTDSPKGFFSKSEYEAWETTSYDFNDTMPLSPYYQWFIDNYPENPEPWQVDELNALNAALPCYNTPSKLITDNLGNVIRTIASNLGAISASTIPADVASPMTQQEAWDALLNAGYIAKQNTDDDVAWVSHTFQPYMPGFHQTFINQFPQNGTRLEDFLAQSCLTTLGVYDIQGQQLYNTDPRLFLKMVREQTVLFNFSSQYGIGGQVLKSVMADAGTRWALANMVGNVVCSFDSRGFEVETKYDNFQRQLGMYVSGGDQQPLLANWAQITIYGETALQDAADYNLVGKPYQDFDESGLSMVDGYNLAGLPLNGKTYLRPDYKTEANWTTEARNEILNATCYTRSFKYNIAGQPISETLPDGSQHAYVYNVNGMLFSSLQKTVNPVSSEEPQWQTTISSIQYNANGQRTQVVNGNGVNTRYTYDELTLQVSRTYTTRDITNTQEQGTVLQDIHYTYDPAGHTISTINNSEDIIFSNNQKVAPRSTYAYDPLYRIISAQGRTMPGLNAPSQSGATKRSDSLPKVSNIADLQNLENYTQRFAYDFGDNLILKRHTAASGSWTQAITVSDSNNHLHTMYVGSPPSNGKGTAQFQYDGNGNMLVLNPNSTAQVNWNYLNHIGNIVSIARQVTDNETGETYTLNDAEYYQYNTSGNRVRKVTERAVQGSTQIEYTEKIYLGNYQLSRTWVAATNADETAPIEVQTEKRTLIVNDGDAPALITHIWVTVPHLQTKIVAGDIQYRYQLCDPLNSVTMEVNQWTELLTFEQYYVYGGTVYTLARSQLEADAKEYRFCGKERDAATGLYYYGARYYADWLGRWMSPDPAGPVDGPNLYEYVSSNPVKYNDPTGMGKVSTIQPGRRSQRVMERNKPQKEIQKNKKQEPHKWPTEAFARKKIDEGGIKIKATRKSNTAEKKRILKQSITTKESIDFDGLMGNSFGAPLDALYRNYSPSEIQPIEIEGETFHLLKSPYNEFIKDPYIEHQKKAGETSLTSNYKDMLDRTRGSQPEKEVAEMLLARDYGKLSTKEQRMSAKQLETVVGVAERFRKEGAHFIFQSFLTRVVNGETSFSKISSEFMFVPSAGQGRQQVSNFLEVMRGNRESTDLSASDQRVYASLPSINAENYETDSEGLRNAKALKSNRYPGFRTHYRK